MDDGLKYTEEAELSRYLFYSDVSDLIVFVEDKDKEYEYETIFERLFNGKYENISILSGHGKSGVKKAFEEFGEVDKKNSSHMIFYIVDGDFDKYIHQEEMIHNEHFIYLDQYNIENYLIDEQAVVKFAKGKLAKLDKEVKKLINFNYWEETIVSQAKKLFLLYCAVQKAMPTEPNVARNAYKFIDSKTGFENNNGYMDYYNHIITQKADIDKDVREVKIIYESINGDNYFGLICGKFLLTSLFVYLQGKIKKHFSMNELRWYLISEFDVSKLNFIKNRINRAYSV